MAGKLTSEQKDEFIGKLKTQMMVQNFQDMLSGLSEKCFTKCVYKPNTSLDSGETKCISQCMDRYMDSRNLVTRSFVNLVQNKQNFNLDLE